MKSRNLLNFGFTHQTEAACVCTLDPLTDVESACLTSERNFLCKVLHLGQAEPDCMIRPQSHSVVHFMYVVPSTLNVYASRGPDAPSQAVMC